LYFLNLFWYILILVGILSNVLLLLSILRDILLLLSILGNVLLLLLAQVHASDKPLNVFNGDIWLRNVLHTLWIIFANLNVSDAFS